VKVSFWKMFCGWSIASVLAQSNVGKEIEYSAKLLGKCRQFPETGIPRPHGLSIHNATDGSAKRLFFDDS
jgi:hypothetical protein